MRLIALLVVLALSLPAYALYDSKPEIELADSPGVWHGTLTYNDYSSPGKLVTLRTTVFISLTRPNELALFYVFDDGPGKTVYSYEQMQFNLSAAEIRWTSGTKQTEVTVSHIESNVVSAGKRRLVFSNASGDHTDRHTLTLSPTEISLRKDEISANGQSTMRDEYRFVRSGG